MIFMKPVIFLFVGVAVAISSLQAAEPTRAKVKRFVETVILGTDYGDSPKVITRWTKAPTVSVFGGTPEQKAVVNEVLATLNPVLKPIVGQMRRLPDNSAEAEMKIYFAPLADLPGIARQHDVGYRKGNWGFCWMFWNGRNEVTSAIVLLASDRLVGNDLKHYTYEQITQSLGLADDSDEFRDSIFYMRGKDGGSATKPSALDLQLLGWLYRQTAPGDDRRTVAEKFEKTWPMAK